MLIEEITVGFTRSNSLKTLNIWWTFYFVSSSLDFYGNPEIYNASQYLINVKT